MPHCWVALLCLEYYFVTFLLPTHRYWQHFQPQWPISWGWMWIEATSPRNWCEPICIILYWFLENRFNMMFPETQCYISMYHRLWSSRAIWCHRPWSALVQVMGYCLKTPSHYLSKVCCLIILETHRKLCECDFHVNTGDLSFIFTVKIFKKRSNTFTGPKGVDWVQTLT